MKEKIKNGIKAVLRQLKDKTNVIIFIIVFLVVSCEVWVPYIIGIITGNAWWFGIGSACWAFWLAPFTPFLPLCLALTFAVRKLYDKIRKGKRNEDNDKRPSEDNSALRQQNDGKRDNKTT